MGLIQIIFSLAGIVCTSTTIMVAAQRNTIRLISRDLVHDQDSPMLYFSWIFSSPDNNNQVTFMVSLIDCQNRSTQQVITPARTTDVTSFSYPSNSFQSTMSSFAQIAAVSADFEFRLNGKTISQGYEEGGNVCLSTSISLPDEEVILQARWSKTPGSSDDCTCPIVDSLPFNQCSCLSETVYNVQYDQDAKTICWKDLNRNMNGTRVFLLIELVIDRCSLISEVYLSSKVFHIEPSNAESFVISDENPCLLDNVTFTCTIPLGEMLVIEWSIPNNVRISIGLSPPNINNQTEPVPGYFVDVIALNETIAVSTLTTAAMEGITVSCMSAGEAEVGSVTIQLAYAPSVPLNIRHLVLEGSTAESGNVSLHWDPPTDNGGRDVTSYLVTISPPAQLSAAVVTSTYDTVTVDYGVRYTVSIVSSNCAGNSTTAEYVFTVCGPMPSVSTGAAVGITLALSAVFFTIISILIGVLIMYLVSRCKDSKEAKSKEGIELKA